MTLVKQIFCLFRDDFCNINHHFLYTFCLTRFFYILLDHAQHSILRFDKMNLLKEEFHNNEHSLVRTSHHKASDTLVLSIYVGGSTIPLQSVSFAGIHDNSRYRQTGGATDNNEPAVLHLYVSLWRAYFCHYCWKCGRYDRGP